MFFAFKLLSRCLEMFMSERGRFGHQGEVWAQASEAGSLGTLTGICKTHGASLSNDELGITCHRHSPQLVETYDNKDLPKVLKTLLGGLVRELTQYLLRTNLQH